MRSKAARTAFGTAPLGAVAWASVLAGPLRLLAVDEAEAAKRRQR